MPWNGSMAELMEGVATKNHQLHAGVRFPPPLIYALAVGMGTLLQYVWPLSIPLTVPFPIRAAVGLSLILAALFFMWLATREFRKARTNLKPWKPTTTLVLSGPFRRSRNPMYVGMSVIQLGIGLWTQNVWTLVALVPTLVVIRFAVIAREERYLERAFGPPYTEFKAKVRRWL